MQIQPRKRGRLLAATAILLSAAAPGAGAQSTDKAGYVTDTRSDVWKSGYNLCWRTGYWSPALAISECDPDLMPRPVAAAPARPAAAAPPAAQTKPAAPEPAAAPRAPIPTMDKVTLSAETLFDFDKSVVKPEGRRRLDELAASLGAVNVDVIVAVGHTDSIGSDSYNQKLSLRRAEAVKAYLVGKGVPAGRITADGKGEKQPVADNRTREGRAKNRRVDVEVIGTRNPRR